ncbi:hypothetical protein PSI23_22265, partial [Xenorhabdus sp. XENO-10]|nr:hypothetical protein [Xenorhabdus yunnanensis]
SDESVTEFIVVTGHTIRHNGVDYPENTEIKVFGDDASRLFRLGVIIRLDDLRVRLLSNNPVTVQSRVKI